MMILRKSIASDVKELTSISTKAFDTDVRFDRRNFTAKMLKLGILEGTGERSVAASNRVPENYRFNKDKYNELKSKGFILEF